MSLSKEVKEKIVLTVVGTVTGAVCAAMIAFVSDVGKPPPRNLEYELGLCTGQLSSAEQQIEQLKEDARYIREGSGAAMLEYRGASTISPRADPTIEKAQRGLSRFSTAPVSMTLRDSP